MATQPCPFFAVGICKNSATFLYSHEVTGKAPVSAPAANKRAAQGHSRPHDQQGSKTLQRTDSAEPQGAENVRAVNPNRTAGQEEELVEVRKRFLFAIPRDAKAIVKARGLSDADLAAFLSRALQLTEAGDTYMQETLQRLASEGGLFRLRGLLKRNFASMEATTLARIWQQQLLPYFKIISHDNVITSAVIEDRHTTLLNTLYNVDGQQAVEIFSAAARQLKAEPARESLAVVVKALAVVLEKNTSAHLNKDMQSTAEVLIEGLKDSRDRATVRCIRSIRTALDLAIDLPEAQHKPKQDLITAIPTFTVEQDLPGDLSSDGPRHDNDSADIRDIDILPTMQEINSSRSEYLPREDPSQWHLSGMAGLIDRHFRLVREDTVGQLRDAAKFEIEQMQHPDEVATNTRQGARTYVYRNVRLQDVRFDETKGLLFVLSFEQPPHLAGSSVTQRATWWSESLRLNPDSLVCLLSSDGHATFLVVHNPSGPPVDFKKKGIKQIQDVYSLAKDPVRAHTILRLNDSDPAAATGFLNRLTSRLFVADHALVEFPGVVFPAFGPTLEALKEMASSLDIPFAEMLVPGEEVTDRSSPPAYSTQAGFNFNLRSLLSPSNREAQGAKGGPSEDIEAVLEKSILDEAQQKAVANALRNSLALIQGPPGTGKSFTGVKLIQALLDNKEAGKLGPIICVCYTNHALDQLLESLIDSGVSQVIRVGSRSKSERLAEINLSRISQMFDLTKMEKQKRGKAKGSMLQTSGQIAAALARHSNVYNHPDEEVLAYLKLNCPHLHGQVSQEVDEEGWTQVGGANGLSPLQSWICSDSGSDSDRPLEDLQSGDIVMAQLSQKERIKLFKSWVHAITSEIYEEMEIQLTAFNDEKETFDSVRNDVDLRILSSANVIGITTTGLARNLKHLRKLPSKVLVVEEAGEVLEAHLLTAMLPSLEHAILIGDHQQLRPKVQNYDLSVDNPRGQIALDISLFERLVNPRHGPSSAGLPYVTLETQRRMHPAISKLVRCTLYPNLQDFPSVEGYPTVKGMRRRLFWLDHDNKEDGKNEHLHSTSQTNTFEVNMVAALVRHLQRQGEYSSQDIAVLTPYLGQLRKLRAKLASFTDIILNDLDVTDLANDAEDDSTDLDAGMPRPSVAKGSLLKALRLATVDNFQGEEAKVVIISLVRSNDERKCGFLRTSNRINVLLSRAQHGMYIIGNRATSEHVGMWQDVIQILEEEGNIGTELELACPRHLDRPLLVSKPEDFALVSPESGCDLLCGKQLPCGHSCPTKCHSETLHNAFNCMRECNRPKKGCEHPCERPCGAVCESECDVQVECDITLACGHSFDALPCYEYQDTMKILCDESTEKVVPGCGHTVEVPCFVSVDEPTFECEAICSEHLECGHDCRNECHECRERDEDGEVEEVDHGNCTTPCGKHYMTCEHSCTSACHAGEDCKPCRAPCSVACAHSTCPKKCVDPCRPCAHEVCSSRCPHSQCNMPCAAPCDWVPCDRRCTESLACGHRCPSICGEICPSKEYCQACASDTVLDATVDLVSMETYREIDLDTKPCLFLSCGHIFTVETLDGQMALSEHYEMKKVGGIDFPVAVKGDSKPLSYEKPKTCPTCRGSLRNISRYGRIVRRSLLDESTKKFIVWSNSEYLPLAEKLKQLQANLMGSVDGAKLVGDIILTSSHVISIPLKDAAGSRYEGIMAVRRRIQNYASKVAIEEQPFQKVRDTVEAVRRRQKSGIPEFKFDQTILQTRGELLASALLLRCDLIMFKDLLTIYEEIPFPERDDFDVSIKFAGRRGECDVLLERAEKSIHVLHQAEANIFWAHFAALECTSTTNVNLRAMEALKKEANERLKRAEEICQRFPAQTSSVHGEIEVVRKMLNESISSSEMRMIVVTMEKEFSGTGHWYRCLNGHPFTIGECGRPNQTSTCPHCGAAIGGEDHQTADGVSAAHEIPLRFGNGQH